MPEAISALAIVGVGVLFCVGCFILAASAWLFAKAIQGVHTARLHSAQADASIRTLKTAEDAVDDIERRYQPGRSRFTPDSRTPTQPEILEVIARQREIEREAYESSNGAVSHDDGRATTTLENEGIDDDLPVHEVGGSGDMYRQ